MSTVILSNVGVVESVGLHASHPGYKSVHWRRADYRDPGASPAGMWVRESVDVRVGDEIRVTVECSAALARATGAAP